MEPPVTARHLTPTLLLLPVGALILAGCAQGSAQSPQEQQNPDAIEVVATTNVYRDIAQRIGADRQQTQTAIGAALPALLTGLNRNTNAAGGAQNLDRALEKDHDGSLLRLVQNA